MFDIDLMNRPGLQKIISKVHVDPNMQKQEIIFGNLDSSEEPIDSSTKKNTVDDNQTSILSLIAATIILSIFFLFGFLRIDEDIKLPAIISKYSNYFKSTNTSNLDIGKSLIINFLSNPEKTQFLRSINLDKNLDINIKIDEIADLNLKSKEAKFLNIIEDEESYNASFHLPINHLISDHNINVILNDLLGEYGKHPDVFLSRDRDAIYFTSNGKIIYKIIEKLIFTNDINITPDVNGKSFILKYSY